MGRKWTTHAVARILIRTVLRKPELQPEKVFRKEQDIFSS